jgi:hypothetical protein
MILTEPITSYGQLFDAVVTHFMRIAQEREAEGANTAKTYKAVAAELATTFETFETEKLSIKDAVEWSGYSEGAIKKFKRAGVPLTRASLPRKVELEAIMGPRLAKR